MKQPLILILGSFLFAAPAAAQEAVPSSQEVGPAVDTFATRCLAEGPRFNQTVALARQQEWPPLAADMAMAFTPVGDPVAIEGWLLGDAAKGDAFPALVVYRAEIAGKTVEGCTVAFSGTDAAAFDRALVLKAQAKPLGEETGEDTLYKRYSATLSGREGAITISLPRYPKGSDQVIASVVAQEVVDN